MSQFRAHPLPLFLVVIWRKEDFPGLAFRVWKTNTTPSPPLEAAEEEGTQSRNLKALQL